jgi:hypothetical protein
MKKGLAANRKNFGAPAGMIFSRNVLALSRAVAHSEAPSDFLAVAAWWIFN